MTHVRGRRGTLLPLPPSVLERQAEIVLAVGAEVDPDRVPTKSTEASGKLLSNPGASFQDIAERVPGGLGGLTGRARAEQGRRPTNDLPADRAGITLYAGDPWWGDDPN